MIRWHAEAYLLAVLICIFSGTWPYVKLLTMLLTWFTPTTTISLEWRSWALEWLDILGKWSLLDCYIMVRRINIVVVFLLLSFSLNNNLLMASCYILC